MQINGLLKGLTEKRLRSTALALATVSVVALMKIPSAAALEEGAVVTSIKPVHSLVSAVMEGVGEPGLIVKGAASPHSYSLRPSEARNLQNAKLVFWIGRDIETFLEKPIESLGENAKLVTLSEAHDLVRLKFREGGPFEAHDHGHDHDEHAHDDHDHDKHDHDEHAHDDHDHDKHDHDEHAHDEHDHDKHDHDEHAHDEHDHDKHDHDEHAHDDHDHDKHDHDEHAHDDHDHDKHDHDEHAHSEIDMHLWLDPQNAKAMLHEIEEALVAIDPANAATYEANADSYAKRLDGLISEISAELEPVRSKSFIVFHDAYQYFENRFGVTAAGSITVNPEAIPGAQRVAEIQERVRALGETCVFAEPQFEPKLVQVVTEGTNARSGVLDPLGTEQAGDGPDLYIGLIRSMASSIKNCLSGNS